MNTDKYCSLCEKPAEFAGYYSSCCNEREMMPSEMEAAGIER